MKDKGVRKAFMVTKRVIASSIEEAIKNERKYKIEQISIDYNWVEKPKADEIGFTKK